MDIQALNAAALEEFIGSAEFKDLEHIPISVHRAESQIRNPRMHADDILLLVAYDGDNMVGYLGMLPDQMQLSGKIEKLAWLSGMWVNPIMRGRGLASQLLKQSYEHWGGHLVVTEMAPVSYSLYKNSGFFNDLTTLKGTRGYLRFESAKLLSRKYPVLRPAKFLLSIIDALLNIINDIRLASMKRKMGADKQYFEIIDSIDESTKSFIESHKRISVFNAGSVHLKWIHENPWIHVKAEKDLMNKRYFFSSVEPFYENYHMRILNNKGTMIGYAMITLRNGHMKLPYIYFNEVDLNEIVQALLKFMLSHRVKMITVFNPVIGQLIKEQKRPYLMIRTILRPYLISKLFKDSMESISGLSLMGGDGDAAFT